MNLKSNHQAASVSELPVIDAKADSNDILARARQQADERELDKYFIVDVDSHIGDRDSWPEVLSMVENEATRESAFFFGGGTGKGALLNGTPGLQFQHVGGRIPHGSQLQESVSDTSVPRVVTLARKAMHNLGLDYQVFFPSVLLSLGMHPVRELEVELAIAYNRWIVERILPHEPRMKALLYLPFNTPKAAEDMVKRFLGAKGVVGFLVTSTRYQPVHANEYMRLYAMLEEAGMPIGFHAHHNWHNEYTRHLNRFISVHALSFVLSNLVHMTNWIVNGLPERFPKLKVIWIESGLAWLPFLMQRLDHEYLMRVSEAPLLKRLPSDYIREMFYSLQPMETTNMRLLEMTMEAINAKTQLLYASDWPHWDFDLPSTVTDLPFLDEESKRNILGLNAARVFGLDIPKKYR
ncbi:amidohydrolase [Allopusillimonas soli]|uniref:Amidohydrolase family protein n=1 Tax=Allopusillimonas soli TaxID=659016 RepID=A0A853F8F4_9BURK|nr:amidohydrolase family protein [Allopusillimonas soli]NYT36267.1 amidohydrolase family protein [Allopusillimonas soli]TEA76591.1 amidohydrolase [Allopusillimonas soli]